MSLFTKQRAKFTLFDFIFPKTNLKEFKENNEVEQVLLIKGRNSVVKNKSPDNLEAKAMLRNKPQDKNEDKGIVKNKFVDKVNKIYKIFETI